MTNGWAVVTGASSGIGLEFARVLARRGQPVVAVARRLDRLQKLAKEACAAGGSIEPLAADLATEQGVQSVAQRMQQLGGRLTDKQRGYCKRPGLRRGAVGSRG